MKTGACSQYINAVGDPFSCFIYQTYRGGSMPGLIIRKGLYNKEYDCYIAHFGKNDIKPIGDSVTMMNRQYVMGHYSELLEQGETTAFIYDCIVSDTGCTAFVRDDYNYHYSNSSLKTYFSKLKFRVINNIFDVKGSGYAAKAEYNTQLNRRKYFYPFYTVSTVVPIIHGIYMSFVYRHPVFLLHPIFAWYVLIEVVVQYSKKILGKISVNTSYAK